MAELVNNEGLGVGGEELRITSRFLVSILNLPEPVSSSVI